MLLFSELVFKRIAFTLLLSLFAVPSGIAQYAEDFSAYDNGSTASPDWQVGRGFWWIKNGSFCESSATYDNGAFLDRHLNEEYLLSVEFTILGDYAGAGVFINSFSPSSVEYAHMIRFDGDRLIYGFLSAGAYQAQGEIALPFKIEKNTSYTMRALVNPRRGTYSIGVNEIELLTDIPLVYFSGYAGIENSGSYACFKRVDLAVHPGTGEEIPLPLAWPVSLAESDGEIWVGTLSDGVVSNINKQGIVKSRLQGRFKGIQKIDILNDGAVAVLDTLSNRIQVFRNGEWEDVLRLPGRAPVSFGNWNRDMLWIADSATPGLTWYNRSDHSNGTLGFGGIIPELASVNSKNVVILDSHTRRIHVFSRDNRELANFGAPFAMVHALEIVDDGVLIAYLDRVEKRSFDGALLAVLDARSWGGIVPRGLHVNGNTVWIADFSGGRLIKTDTSLSIPSISSSIVDRDRIQLRWPVSDELETEVVVTGSDDRDISVENLEFESGFAVATIHYQPNELYHVSIQIPADAVVPERFELTIPQPVMGPPEPRHMQFRELEVAVILLTDVRESDSIQNEPVSPTEVDRIKGQVEAGRLFYWMTSGMTFHIKPTYVVDSRPRYWSDMMEDLYYYPPKDSVIESILASHGLSSEDFPAVVFLPLMQEPTPEGSPRLSGRGGGFTNGLGWNGQYGRSWWIATEKDHPAGNNWLFVHEFHHQLDELFQLSGYPEYWFNHFTPHLGWAADFGEHFDGNAYIVRNWPRDRWFDLNVGSTRWSSDLDEDGIPDNDPSLPMDELRLKSDPGSQDSDGDGLTDLVEVKFSNWNAEGWGQTVQPGFEFNALNTSDTDRDGIPDRDDPEPLHRFNTDINFVFSTIGSFDVVGAGDVQARWSPDSLIIRFANPDKKPIRVLLDLDANGWFMGKENVEFTWDSKDGLRARVFNAGEPDRWPFTDEERVKLVSVTTNVSDQAVEFHILPNKLLQAGWVAGKRIAIDASVGYLSLDSGGTRYFSMGEPNRFIEFTLTPRNGE